MCLAIPSRIIQLDGNRAKVELSGNVIEADVSLLDDAAAGDWVLVHAGFAIEKLNEDEAQETLAMFVEMQGDASAPEA